MSDTHIYKTDEQIFGLLKSIADGETLLPGDQLLIDGWKDQSSERAAMVARLSQPDTLRAAVKKLYAIDKNAQQRLAAFLQEISPVATSVHRVHFLKTAWFRYAAILLLIAGTAIYLYTSPSFRKNRGVTKKEASPQPQDISPGGNKATLTLSDGSTIVLDSAAIGNLAEQSGTKILKLDAGKLAYQSGAATGEIGYNTISTPKGGQYQIALPDGSKVWLNAASSVRFPTAFAKNRNVSITGEVYFEIAADKSKPFFVTANQAQVEVLGTSFNMNAYADEASINTSLLEGSVRVSKQGIRETERITLKPGQQARIAGAGNEKKQLHTIVVEPADMNKVMAWKNGTFNFEGLKLEEAMRQLSRWYDIEVIYEKGIPNIQFIGEISRNFNLSELIKALEMSNLHFRLEEGRRLVVLP